MRRAMLLAVWMVLFLGITTLAFGVGTEECMIVRKEIQSARGSLDQFYSVYEAHRPSGSARCNDLRGEWFCFQCLDSGGIKLIHVLLRDKAVPDIKGYGCPCKRE